MIRKILVLYLLIVGFSEANGQRTSDEIRRNLLNPSGMILVAAHRGAHNKYPENSLAAIEEAIRLGVDIAEVDVKVSKDGVPFLMHDRTMDRTTTGKGDPEEYTWEELQRFNIVHNGNTTSLKIPSLEEVLNTAKGKILIDLDIKTDGIKELIKVINKTGTNEMVIFFDDDYQTLSAVQKVNKDFMLMPRAHSGNEIDSAILLFDPPVVHIDFGCYTSESAASIKESFARIWINALGEPDTEIRKNRNKRTLKKLLANGANIIQTDEPELLLKVLEKSGYRTELTNL